jgi:hypothetical protein
MYIAVSHLHKSATVTKQNQYTINKHNQYYMNHTSDQISAIHTVWSQKISIGVKYLNLLKFLC